MPETGRIHISLSDGTLEVEGPIDFVATYADDISAMLDRLKNQTTVTTRAAGGGQPDGSPPVRDVRSDLGEFGEVLHALPKGVSGVDQILVAGYYASRANADSTFSTNEANRLLIDQGVKLSNASQALKNNVVAKRVFKSGKGYKVSRIGDDYVRSLIQP